jgi:hypothetical protein
MTKKMKECRKFLTLVRKTKENAMDILLLSQACEADEARQQCCDVLQQMVTLTELESHSAFTDLDGPSTRTLLLPIVKRFQECLNMILPELVGSMDGMLYLWCNENNATKMGGVPNTCPEHRVFVASYKDTRFGRVTTESRTPNFPVTYDRIKCNACLATFKQMATNARGYQTPSCMFLSANIVSVLEEMMDLMKD